MKRISKGEPELDEATKKRLQFQIACKRRTKSGSWTFNFQMQLLANAEINWLCWRLQEIEEPIHLKLAHNNFSHGGAVALSKVKNLVRLDLWDNNIGDDGAAAIAKLHRLRWLNIGDCAIGPKGANEIAKLKNLTVLHLGDNNIGDAGANAVMKLQKLTLLNIYKTGITPNAIAALRKLNCLTALDVSDNRLGNEGAAEVAKLQRISRLCIGHNSIGELGGGKLATLRRLIALDVNSNAIGNTSAAQFMELQGLVSLRMRNNVISDPNVVIELSKLPCLRSLSMSGNPLRWPDTGATLPDDVCQVDNPDRLRNLLEDYRRGGQASIAFGRGVLLGPGENGKTQLSRHLAGHPDRHVPIDKDDRTWGIVPWEVTLDDLRIALLDCGGQDTQLSAHTNLILMGSTRSIYLICFRADRVPDYAPYYFGLLQEVRKRAMGLIDPAALPRDKNDKVPVIVIVTFGDAPDKRLELVRLKGVARQYPWLHVLFVESYEGLEGHDINEIRDRMRDHVKGMTQIRTAMSATMQRLRPRVRKLFQADEPVPTAQTPPPTKCMISLEDYLTLYKNACDPEEALALEMADHHLRELDNLCDVIAPDVYRTIDPRERLPLEQAVQWVLNPRFVNVYLYQRILRDGGRLGKNGFLSNQDIRSVTQGLKSHEIEVLMKLMVDRLIAFPWTARGLLGDVGIGFLVPDLLLPREVPADWQAAAHVVGRLNCKQWLGEVAYFQFLSERNRHDQLAALPLSKAERLQTPLPTGVFRNECLIIDGKAGVQALVQFSVLHKQAAVFAVPYPGGATTSRVHLSEVVTDILSHLKRLTIEAEPTTWVEQQKLDADAELHAAILKIIDRFGKISGRKLLIALETAGAPYAEKRVRDACKRMDDAKLIRRDGPATGAGAKWVRRRASDDGGE